MASQVREIRVVAKTSGSKELKQLAQQFAQTNKSVQGLSRGFTGLRNVFGGFLATLGVREITRASDEFQLFNDRIKAFVGDSKVAEGVFENIVDVARRTKTSVSALGDIYNRVALSTKDLGLSNEQIIDTVEVLQNTFRIAGSSIAEATGATVQLTQGLSAGALRGQELRSVLEANAVLADILAKQFNISRGQLIKFAETGKITAEKVLTALANNAEEVNRQAQQLGQTFEQSTIIALDAFKKKIFELNRDIGVSSGFAKSVDFLISNIDTLFNLITAFVVAGTLVTLATQLKAISAVLKGSALLTLVTPTRAAFAAITALTYAFVELSDVLEKRSLSKVKDDLKVVNKEIDYWTKKLEAAKKPAEGAFDKAKAFFKGETAADIKRISSELDYWKKQQEKLNKELDKFDQKSGKGLDTYKTKTKVAERSLKDLNLEYATGVISLKQYNQELLKLEKAELSQQFQAGTISLVDFERKLGLIERRIRSLNGAGGTVFDGFKLGVQQYVADIDVVKQGAETMKSAFDGMNDALFESIKDARNAEDAFKAFFQNVLDDLLKLAIRLTITNQLAIALNNSLAGKSTATPGSMYEFSGTTASVQNVSATAYNGKVFNKGNVIPHYNGGVVDKMSAFPMSGGRIGTIAERGPEAIMPLERTSDGKLGVKANAPQTVINVINNTPSNVETRETEGPGGQRQIEIIVNETVKRGFANGEYDKTMTNRYAVKPRGR